MSTGAPYAPLTRGWFLDRLPKYGYVAARSTGLELVQYRITKRGEDAILDNTE